MFILETVWGDKYKVFYWGKEAHNDQKLLRRENAKQKIILEYI